MLPKTWAAQCGNLRYYLKSIYIIFEALNLTFSAFVQFFRDSSKSEQLINSQNSTLWTKNNNFFLYHNAFFPIVEPYLTDGASGARKNGQIYHLHNSVVNCKEEGEKKRKYWEFSENEQCAQYLAPTNKKSFLSVQGAPAPYEYFQNYF